jgi:polyisoprenoid-binding protein YceI
MKTITLYLFFLLPLMSMGQALKIDGNTSSVSFIIKNAGLSVDGKFPGLNGTIVFNSSNLAESKFEVSLNSKSINTGISARDNHLRKAEFFDVEKFPLITFTSKSIVMQSKSNYITTGNLIIKGKTKEVKIPFTYNENGVFEGSFTINRLDYGVGESSWVMSDDVTIKLKVITTK